MDAIYFTKVEYREFLHCDRDHYRWIILLNLQEGELSFQTYSWKRKPFGMEGLTTETIGPLELAIPFSRPVMIVKNGKTNFKDIVIADDYYEPEVTFSYAIKLSKEQLQSILPYCNALDFEPFRGKTMSMKDEGYLGYRDELNMSFRAVSDSYLPMLELPMDYYYDESHIWPSERLYRYLVKNYFSGKKKLRGKGPSYGAGSLFF